MLSSCGIEQGAQACEPGALRLVVALLGRYRHQAAQSQTRQRGDVRQQLGQLLGCDAAFGSFVAEMNLHANGERRRVRGSLRSETVGEFGAIDRVHPVEVFGDRTCFVRLQLADEVPNERSIAKRSDFRQCFLQVVLAEIALAEFGQLRDASGRLCLRDGDQLDVRRVAAVALRSGGDPRSYRCESPRRFSVQR